MEDVDELCCVVRVLDRGVAGDSTQLYRVQTVTNPKKGGDMKGDDRPVVPNRLLP